MRITKTYIYMYDLLFPTIFRNENLSERRGPRLYSNRKTRYQRS